MGQREIKFRAWDEANVNCYNSVTDSKRMSYYGPAFTMDDSQNVLMFITPEYKQGPFGDHNSMGRYNLMQYTGLKDKNGVEIYEGDIFIFNDGTPPHIVKWERSGYYLPNEEFIEVIGNIYEHPELLKK